MEIGSLDFYSAIQLFVGSVIAIIFFYFIVWPRVSLKNISYPAQLTGVSSDFYTYVQRWMSWVSVFGLIIVLIWGVILYLDLTAEKVTLWLAGSGAIVLLILSRIPEAENAVAAVTVYFRGQVSVGDEFDIIYPDGRKEAMTFINRNERFNYGQRFDGTRDIAEIPHTLWVNSLISNLSRQPVRWTSKIPLRFAMGKRDEILDKVDEYVIESKFADVAPDSVSYNYMTKLVPEVFGHFPEQVASIYTMVSSRDYGFTHENAFLDGLYRVLDTIEGVTIAQGES